MRTSDFPLILKNKTHVLELFDPVLKNDAFAGSTPMMVVYIDFRNSSQCNFPTGNYFNKTIINSYKRKSQCNLSWFQKPVNQEFK